MLESLLNPKNAGGSVYITKKLGQKCEYVKNKRSFKLEIKSFFIFFIIFTGLLVVRNCLRPETRRLIEGLNRFSNIL